MTDHPKCRPSSIALSDCPSVPSYCEGFCPPELDGRSRYRQHELANRRGGYTVEAREIRIGDSRCPDVVDFGAIEPPSGSIRGRDRYRKYVSSLVAGGRYEL